MGRKRNKRNADPPERGGIVAVGVDVSFPSDPDRKYRVDTLELHNEADLQTLQQLIDEARAILDGRELDEYPMIEVPDDFEIAPELANAIRQLGDHYGPMGLALAAVAAVGNTEAVVQRLGYEVLAPVF